MPISFAVKNPDGGDGNISSGALVEQLRGMGVNATGISPDGTMLTMSDGSGSFQVAAQDVLKHHGWEVRNATPEPENLVTDFVDPQMRRAIEALPHDGLRETYLMEQMRKRGYKDPKVIGNGSDWYFFDPQSSKYYAMTNKEGLDWSDAQQAIAAAPEIMGSLAGGAVGLGAGGPAGMIAGAGIGGAAGQSLGRAAIAADDPTFRGVAEENMGELAKDAGITGLYNAGGAALPGLVGAARKFSPISSVMKGAGAIGQGVGEVVGDIAGKLKDTEIGRQVVGGLAAPTADLAGFALQAPAWLSRAGAKAAEWAGDMLPRGGSPLGAKLRGFARSIKQAPRTVPSWAEEMAGAFGSRSPAAAGGAPQASVQSIYGNLGARVGKAQARSKLGETIGREGVGDNVLRDGFEEAAKAAEEGYQTGAARIGKPIEYAERAGQKIQSGIDKLGGAILGTAHGAGRAAQGIGSAAKTLGTVGQSLEPRAYTRYGAEALFGRPDGPTREELDEMKRRMLRSSPTLVAE